MLSAQNPSDRAVQLLALTRRLTDRLAGDTAVLEAHRPQDLIGGIEETRSLSNLYRMETARIKADRNSVLDRARIEDVVAKVKARARDAGLSEAIAEPVWRTLIDRCIAYEFDRWDEIRSK